MATEYRTDIAHPAPPPAPDTGRMLAAALRLLDTHGLAGVTPARLATALNVEPAAVRRHFARRQDLLAAMTDAITGDLAGPAGDRPDWRDHLRQRAGLLRDRLWERRDGALLVAQTGLSHSEEQCQPSVAALCAEGFSRAGARAALLLVDRFVLGSTVAEQAIGTPKRTSTQPFRDQLEVILNGLAASHDIADGVSVAVQTARFQPRLWILLRSARESADIAYSRTMQLSELDRRILLFLNTQEELALVHLAVSVGADKAQVSRACKRLDEQGMVERAGPRGPLRLSGTGRELANRMVRLAALRDRELAVGVSVEQLAEMYTLLEALIARAVVLYEQERQLAIAARNESEDPPLTVAGQPAGAMVIDRSRILPPLMTLCAYMMRSAALSYKRLTGLSRFESWVLSEIAAHPPLEWSRLVQLLDRDHSQAGRTVNRLIELDLITRSGGIGRREGRFSPTDEGSRMFDMIRNISAGRTEFLMRDIPPAKLKRFLTAFETIVSNAEAQLSRERAIAQATG